VRVSVTRLSGFMGSKLVGWASTRFSTGFIPMDIEVICLIPLSTRHSDDSFFFEMGSLCIKIMHMFFISIIQQEPTKKITTALQTEPPKQHQTSTNYARG
jgi:hypothetical protein